MNPVTLSALLLSSPLFAGMFSTLLMGRRATADRIPGLLFHSVLPVPGKELSHYPADRFESFCKRLSESPIQTVCVGTAAAGIPDSTDNHRPLLLTFDDGLDTVFHHALPLLEAYGLKATIFCLGGYFGALSTWDIYTGNRHLTRQQIRTLADKGMEIGSHTVTHPCLPYLDQQSVLSELVESKKILEDCTGRPVTSLAFPYGCWNRKIWETACDAGYTAATLYRGQPGKNTRLFPVNGVYRFDSVDDIIEKISVSHRFSSVLARTRMMPHFARGTPIWRYRKTYSRI